MKKKVLIDATPVTSLVDGLSHYIINLIKYLPGQSFNEFEYTILINKGLTREEFTSFLATGKYKILERKIAPIGPKRDWDMFWFLVKYKKKFDLIHITSNNYPFSLGKGICTIHDITFKRYFDHPKYSFNLATTYMNAVIKRCLKKSTAIIAVSNSTKNELLKWYGLSEKKQNKIRVVYQGWEHLLKYDAVECIDKFTISNQYLFYLGTTRIHKNISHLLTAFKLSVPHIPAHKKLAISGSSKYLKKEDKILLREINDKGPRIIFTDYLSNECVEKYFKNADAYILPSLSEGFGIPILEAFYYQTPVLCSNTTSLPEVAGNAALYFDPYDPEDIANAIIKFYNEPVISQKLIAAGNEQLKKFSWTKTAAETVEIYRKFS
ncbi:MAG TPA: glycosyltransferase family 1 protein [Chitinophagaceae bacterium]|nr:glycosyltransferase family 1 protein [Chitinophagaceae bacterium]